MSVISMFMTRVFGIWLYIYPCICFWTFEQDEDVKHFLILFKCLCFLEATEDTFHASWKTKQVQFTL